jgi:hypothetical protein
MVAHAAKQHAGRGGEGERKDARSPDVVQPDEGAQRSRVPGAKGPRGSTSLCCV